MSSWPDQAAPGRAARRKDRRRQLGKTPGADLADRPLTAAERAERSDPARPFSPEAEIAKSPIFTDLQYSKPVLVNFWQEKSKIESLIDFDRTKTIMFMASGSL